MWIKDLFFNPVLAFLVVIVGFSFYSPHSIFAQDNNSEFFPFTAAIEESELPHHAVHHIMQDRFGFIWISTRDGLCIYDGKKCLIPGSQQGFDTRLTSNLVWLTYQDSQDRIWMASKGSGVGFYNYRTDTYKTFRNDPDDSTSIAFNIVTVIFEDDEQNIWIGTDGGGLQRVIDRGEDEFEFQTIPMQEEELSILDIEQDKTGKLWLASYGNGIIILDPETGETESLNTNSDPLALTGNFVMSLAKEDSIFWAGTKFGGLIKIDPNTNQVANYTADPSRPGSLPINFVWDIYVDDERNKWVGTYGGGLALLGSGEEEFKIISDSRNQPLFTDDFVLHIMQDNTGQFWISTDNQGTFNFKKKPVFRPLDLEWVGEQNASNLIINDLFLDSENSYWISTNQGLFRSDSSLQEAVLFDQDFETTIFYETTEDASNTIWIASNYNLYYYSLDDGTFGTVDVIGRINKPGTDRFFDIQMGNHDDLWLASDGGLIHYIPKEDKLELFEHRTGVPTSITGNKLNTLFKEDVRLWITTDDRGVSIFDTETKKAHELDVASFFDDNVLSEIFTDVQADIAGNIWLGSSDHGIFTFYRTGTGIDSVAQIDTEAGLLSDHVYDFLAIDSTMLVSLKHGLSMIDIRAKEIKNLDLPPSTKASGKTEFHSVNGKHYFYHKDKIFQINTDGFREEAEYPPLMLTDLEVYNEDLGRNSLYRLEESLTLDHTEDFLTISYRVLNFDMNRVVPTQYMLEGRDPYWLKGGEAETINYTNLEPGSYMFKVRIANAPENNNMIKLPVTISHPFWDTLWFKFGIIFVFIMTLYSGYKYRMYYLLKEERTRNRIARDLHDDVSATLSSISFFSDAVRKVKGETSDKSDHYLELISQSASEAKEKINDIIWAIDPSKDDWSTFLTKCKRFAADALDSKEIEYELDISETFHVPVKLELRQNLWLIYKEMVNNLVVHSKATKAAIIFKEEGRSIYLEVSDNGIGIDVEKESNRNGLKNIRQRAALLDGKLHLDTAPQKGTKWILKIQV